MNSEHREASPTSLTGERKPGRPKAIPERLVPKVLSLLWAGVGLSSGGSGATEARGPLSGLVHRQENYQSQKQRGCSKRDR
jgi:hypothetical protein